jgi:hypothetical protein
MPWKEPKMKHWESFGISSKKLKRFTTMLISTRTVSFPVPNSMSRQTKQITQRNKTTFENVLSSQRNLWDIEAAYHQHLTDYRIALAELESLVGSNLGSFGGLTEGLSK